MGNCGAIAHNLLASAASTVADPLTCDHEDIPCAVAQTIAGLGPTPVRMEKGDGVDIVSSFFRERPERCAVEHAATDWDLDGISSAIEWALFIFQIRTHLERWMAVKNPARSAQHFIDIIATSSPSWCGVTATDPSTLRTEAQDLTADMQQRLELEPDNRALWLASWQLWDLRLEFEIVVAPWNYDALIAERERFYAPAIATDDSRYRQAFFAYAGMDRARLDFSSRIKLMHTGTIDDVGRKNHLRAAFEMSRNLLDLQATHVETLPGHRFMHAAFGYDDRDMLELSMALASCPILIRNEQRAGREPPFSFVGNAKHVLDCFGPVTVGQMAGAAEKLDVDDQTFNDMVHLAASLLGTPELQTHWTELLANPDRIDIVWHHSLVWLAVADEKIFREKFGGLLGLVQGAQTIAGLFDTGATAASTTPAETLHTAGVVSYVHRADDLASFLRSRSLGLGAEVDVTTDRDGNWFVYHEPTLWGVNVVDLSSHHLDNADIPRLSAYEAPDSPLIIDIKTNHFHRDREFSAKELENLLATLRRIRTRQENVIIDSVNRRTLQQLKTLMAAQGDTFRTGYVTTEFAELKEFAEEIIADPAKGTEIDDLLLYWYQYARLRDVMGASALQILQQRFHIIAAENDQERVAARVKELPCQGLVADQ